MFTYYGSSKNLGERFKYHYFNGPKQKNFLGLFLSVFKWNYFSITIVEVVSSSETNFLRKRENWYLNRFKPLLNVLITAEGNGTNTSISILTRSKISLAIKGTKDSEVTRMKKRESRMGNLNPFFGKGPGILAINKAAELSGTKVYVYTMIDNETSSLDAEKSTTKTLVYSFRRIRATCKVMPISPTTLSNQLDRNLPFKGYYYYRDKQV